MGTKSNPAPNDCYTKAEEDEPLFTLLARDPLAADLVRDWANRRRQDRGPSEKVDEAFRCADAMDRWREAAMPDHPPTAGPVPEGGGRTGLGSRSRGPCRIHLVVELADDDGFVDSTGIYARRGYVEALAEAMVTYRLTDENAVKVRAVEYGKFRWTYPT